MRFDELYCSFDDLARTLVIVLNVEGVMSRRVIDHFDCEILGECELYESIDSVI